MDYMSDIRDTLRKISDLPEPVRLALLAVPGPGWWCWDTPSRAILSTDERRAVRARAASKKYESYKGKWAWLPCSEAAIVEAARLTRGERYWLLEWTGLHTYNYIAELFDSGERANAPTALEAALALFCSAHGAEWPEEGAK
jgi:hypothetical protein